MDTNKLYRPLIIAIIFILIITLTLSIKPSKVRASYGDCLAFIGFANGSALNQTDNVDNNSNACPQLTINKSSHWSISSNTVHNSPVAGSELFTDTGLETWTNATTLTNWARYIQGTSTLNREGTIKYAGSYSARCDIDSSNSACRIGQAPTVAVGSWAQYSAYVYASASGKMAYFRYDYYTSPVDPGSNWTQYISIQNVKTANNNIYFRNQSAASSSIYFDNTSLKLIPLADLTLSVNLSTTNTTTSVDIVRSPNTVSGILFAMDADSDPKNFLIAYLNGSGYLMLDKAIWDGTNVVYTNILNEAVTYSSGATLTEKTYLTGSNLSVDIYYNGSQVGTTQTISDSVIINNTRVGIFSTYASNTLDNFHVTDNNPNTPTYTPTASKTNTPTVTNTNTLTPTYTPTNTNTNTYTPTFTNTYTPTASNTYTPTASNTPTETFTLTPSLTFTPSHTYTFTPSRTFTQTNSLTPTNTFTQTYTQTPSITDTPTVTNTPTFTLTPSITNTPIPAAVLTGTYEAAYNYYSGVAQSNYPVVIILSIICGIFILGLVVWGAITYLRRR